MSALFSDVGWKGPVDYKKPPEHPVGREEHAALTREQTRREIKALYEEIDDRPFF